MKYTTTTTLKEHLKKHNLSVEDIRNLPIAINSPIMVYEWGEKAKSKIIITQIPRGEQRITVAIKMERGGKKLSVNELASVHGKDVERLINEMLTTKSDFGKDNLKYVNKEIAMQWLGIAPPEGAASLTDAQQSIAKIIKDFPNPKIEARNSLITPEMDATYLDAVERGDMETAQKMVMEAAKLAMPNTKVVDEDGNPKVVYHGSKSAFNVFRLDEFGKTDAGFQGKGFYFTPDEAYAQTYGDINRKFFLNITNPIDAWKNEIEAFAFGSETVEDVMARVENVKEDLGDKYEAFVTTIRETITPEKLAELNVHDGTMLNTTYSPEYVAGSSNQIKSADPVTYDDAGNVIPLSERFNPEKEDIRYSLVQPANEEDARFERKVAFLSDLVREYNIPLPTFISQTKEEFKRMLLEYGVPEAEIYEDKAAGYYSEDDDIILINGGLMKKPSDISNALLHENAHNISVKQMREKIARVAETLSPNNVNAMLTEFFDGGYKDLNEEEIVHEVVSYMVGYLQIDKTIPTFEVQISIEEFIDAWKEVISNSRYSNDVKEVFFAALPLVKENINYQKKQYGAKKTNTIVIPRKEHAGSVEGGHVESSLQSDKESRPIEAFSRNAEADRRGEGADAQELVRFNWIKQGLGSDSFTYSYYSQYSMLPYIRFNIM